MGIEPTQREPQSPVHNRYTSDTYYGKSISRILYYVNIYLGLMLPLNSLPPTRKLDRAGLIGRLPFRVIQQVIMEGYHEPQSPSLSVWGCTEWSLPVSPSKSY